MNFYECTETDEVTHIESSECEAPQRKWNAYLKLTYFKGYDFLKIIMANKRKLRDAWLEMEEFKPWQARVDGDPTKAYCMKC